MATERVTAKRTVCDGCGKTFFHEDDDDDIVLGFHGAVFHHYASGGNSAEWYAHTERCIKNAVVNALQAALDPDPPSGGDWDPVDPRDEPNGEEREALQRRVHGTPAEDDDEHRR
jgi:hypothetical protein